MPSISTTLPDLCLSDTGIGSCLEEFQDLNCSSIIAAEFWGKPRHGTEVYLSISESIDVLVSEINHFFQKNIAIEVVTEREDIPGSRCENVFLANKSNPGPLSTSNVECLKSGLEDYVSRHGNSLTQKCNTCFATSERLKVGSGIACSTENHKSSGLMMEVVVIISELESKCPCFRECSSKTEVLYFKDFTPCSISHSTLNVLSTIDWQSYGLTLENVVDQGVCVLEWGDSPSHSQIDMVLHCYNKQYPMHKTQPEQHLIKKAFTAALNNLKETHPGILRSAHALKICSHAPDLARSIAGLILSSNDPDFQGECFSLLGLESREIGANAVEDCIQEKIVSVIEMNDRKPRQRNVVAPSLFEDDCDHDSNYQDKEYEEGEDEFLYLD
uniref:Type 2 DNA topoisomerase 6 subunit B-like n=1 Tax=Salix viminalis TaxID=40686 RepID=A0A6N2N392_SALVM